MKKRGSVWKKVKPTALYLNCLKKGHKVVVKKFSWGLLYLECLDCGKVWRAYVYRMDYIEDKDVPEVFESGDYDNV
jgi:hypothetical protein